MRVGITGHRPDKLWGYDLSHEKYKILSNNIISFLKENNAKYCISGMALGVDIVFAISVLKLKKEIPIALECAIPCLNHSSKWTKSDQDLYNKVLSKADVMTLVTNASYSPYLMQKRNKYIVDNCDILLAIWDGSKGETGNCVKYARSNGVNLHIINPNTL